VVGAYQPDIVLGFGGYSSFPTVLMARLMGRRALIQEQNVVPGLANRFLAKFVPAVCVGFRDSVQFFSKGKAVWTGTPQRPLNSTIDRQAAAQRFGLDPAKPTVLVFGGSQGARRINACFFEMFSALSDNRRFQVIHATGKNDFSVFEQKYAAFGRSCYVRAFIDNIDEAYAAADIVVARAGAGTVTELGVLGIPAVLIPYPGAKNHQVMNAKVLERSGAAVIIEEKSLSSQLLGDKIFTVLERKSSRRNLQEKLRNEFPADPARHLVDELERIRLV
jgi:UDP-N-acetylglucosamine--N-acetylmuramyl-(pentapeptide) pyrophosphoryl-undecaprenol N-acetylglucosamine transferase